MVKVVYDGGWLCWRYSVNRHIYVAMQKFLKSKSAKKVNQWIDTIWVGWKWCFITYKINNANHWVHRVNCRCICKALTMWVHRSHATVEDFSFCTVNGFTIFPEKTHSCIIDEFWYLHNLEEGRQLYLLTEPIIRMQSLNMSKHIHL